MYYIRASQFLLLTITIYRRFKHGINFLSHHRSSVVSKFSPHFPKSWCEFIDLDSICFCTFYLKLLWRIDVYSKFQILSINIIRDLNKVEESSCKIWIGDNWAIEFKMCVCVCMWVVSLIRIVLLLILYLFNGNNNHRVFGTLCLEQFDRREKFYYEY